MRFIETRLNTRNETRFVISHSRDDLHLIHQMAENVIRYTPAANETLQTRARAKSFLKEISKALHA